MPKATKRSRKFVAKGGPSKALEKPGARLAKRGRAKDGPSDGDDDDEGGGGYVQDEDAMGKFADELAEDDDEGGEEGKGGYPMKKQFERQQKEAEDRFLLTPNRLERLEQGAFASHSAKGLKRMVAAYRTACHLSDADRQDRDGDEDDEEGARRRKKEFRIESPAVFDRLMAVCLGRCHEEFRYHLLGKGSGAKEEEEEEEESSGSDGEGSDSDEEEEEPKQKGAKKDATKKEEATAKLPDENRPIHPKTLAKSPRFAAVRPLLESFLRSTLHVLDEAGKEAKLLRFVLAALSKYVPYLSATPKLAKPFLKTCARLWAAPLDSDEEHNAVRLQAFLRIRQLAITQPYPFVEDALKATYLGYARRSKFGTAASVGTVLPTLTFMGNCVVELYGLDYASSYQHAFVYVRQLALHLRSATTKRTPEAMGAVCCWQYVHCLKLWTAVLSAACGAKAAAGRGGGGEDAEEASGKPGAGAGGKDEEANLLRSLVYPLTEVILGVCRLVPPARWAPLRLHCVRLLQQLAASTETFIPTTSLLLGVLDHREVGMKPIRGGGKGKGKGKGGGKVKSTVQGLRLPLILKLPKENTLRTTEQLDGVLGEVFVLLNRELDLYRYSPGFPEFTFAIVQRLRKFNKEINNGRWRAYAKGTIELCEKHSAFAVKGRSTLTDAPKDVRRLEALKPSNVPAMGERHDAAVAKERRLEAATRPATKSGKGDKRAKEGAGKNTEGGKKRKKRDEEKEAESDADSVEEEGIKKGKTKRKKKKKAAVVNKADLENVGALKEEDEVQEGIWSDSD
ncbi:hypothetical protein ACHAWF_017582 [Thalassiosira exigua]